MWPAPLSEQRNGLKIILTSYLSDLQQCGVLLRYPTSKPSPAEPSSEGYGLGNWCVAWLPATPLYYWYPTYHVITDIHCVMQ